MFFAVAIVVRLADFERIGCAGVFAFGVSIASATPATSSPSAGTLILFVSVY